MSEQNDRCQPNVRLELTDVDDVVSLKSVAGACAKRKELEEQLRICEAVIEHDAMRISKICQQYRDLKIENEHQNHRVAKWMDNAKEWQKRYFALRECKQNLRRENGQLRFNLEGTTKSWNEALAREEALKSENEELKKAKSNARITEDVCCSAFAKASELAAKRQSFIRQQNNELRKAYSDLCRATSHVVDARNQLLTISDQFETQASSNDD